MHGIINVKKIFMENNKIIAKTENAKNNILSGLDRREV